MANKAITQLPVAQNLTGDEQTVVVQNGVTKQASVSQIANAASPGKLITAVELDQTNYNLIFYYSDGTQSQTGPIPGYVSATINNAGRLILTDTLGNTTDCGVVAATATAGTTTTGLPGTNASVVNVGTTQAAVFNFTIPRGDKGEQGDPGAAGTFSGGTTGFTPNTPTSGNIVLDGILNVSNGGTGTTTLTGYVKGNGTSPMTDSLTVPTSDLSGTISNSQLANSTITINGNLVSLGGSASVGTVTSVSGAGSVNGITLTGTVTSTGNLTLGGTLGGIGNSQLTNSSVTYNGQTVALGGSGTITAANPNALTIGTGLTGASYDGITAVTIAIDSTVATLTGTQVLTNKTISGADNSLSNIGNSSLTNSSVTFNGQTVGLGASGTITSNTNNALTIGTGLSGTSFNGSTPTTIAIDSTVATLTGTQVLTNKTISGNDNTLSNIGNSSLTNSSVTFNGQTVALGGSGTVTATTTNALTIGTGLTGTSFNGSGATTIAIDNTVATLTGIQTLTNKTINAANNTLSNIGNSSLTNSSVTFNGQTVALGGSGTVTATTTNALTIGTGLTGTSFNGSGATTITIDSTVATLTGTQILTNKTIDAASNTLSNIGNSSLTNSSITLGTTSVSLGGTATTLGGLTSVAVTQDPTTALQLTTKQYVDALVSSGVHFHEPVRVESPINLNATYNNGTAGVGATLTNAGTQAVLVIDGVTVSVADRVLVYQQTDQTQNGVYVVSNVGSGSTNWVLTRSADTDSYGFDSPNALSEGSTFFVQQGTTGAGETYTCNTAGTIVFGTTLINFVQISSAQIYSAGTGLTLSGTQFSITNTAVTPASYGSASKTLTATVNAQGQLTALADTNISIAPSQINATIPNSGLTNSSVTFNGQTVALGASGTVTANTTNALTIGTGLSGTSFNGSGPVTIAIDSTVATLTGVQTLTNKTIDAASNTLSNIGNSSLTNSSVTFNGQTVALGASGTVTATTTNALTIGTGLSGTSFNGSGATTIAIDSTVATLDGAQVLTNKTINAASNTLSNIGNSSLTNSSITINGSAISLGGSVSVGTVTSVGGTAPVSSTGGNTPTISMTQSNSTTDGYLSATDWNTFNNKGSGNGTVTSVSGTGTVSGISLSGTVTSSGNLTLGGTLDLSSPPAIGGTVPAAITGTTITATNYVGISGGTF